MAVLQLRDQADKDPLRNGDRYDNFLLSYASFSAVQAIKDPWRSSLGLIAESAHIH